MYINYTHYTRYTLHTLHKLHTLTSAHYTHITHYTKTVYKLHTINFTIHRIDMKVKLGPNVFYNQFININAVLILKGCVCVYTSPQNVFYISEF